MSATITSTGLRRVSGASTVVISGGQFWRWDAPLGADLHPYPPIADHYPGDLAAGQV